MTDSGVTVEHSAQRIEALTDGIYAVAMTLLVIDLKLPDRELIHSTSDLINAVVQLAPRFLAWLISFLVLALFWYSHHRSFGYVRRATGRLMALNLVQLAFVSLMPFCSALIGEHVRSLFSQIVYSTNMVVLAVFSLLVSRYVFRHPDLATTPMPRAAFRGIQMRIFGLIAISALSVGIGMVMPGFGNLAFMLMAIIMPLSRRIEARLNH